jgi:hypothetical protein
VRSEPRPPAEKLRDHSPKNCAVQVVVLVAVKVRVAPLPAQPPLPDQPSKRAAEVSLAVMVTLLPASTTQLSPAHARPPAGCTATLPRPLGELVTVTVTWST